MKDEIKEIFRRMNDLIEHKFDKEYHTECDLFEDIQKLLDYITNLQEENKKLKVKLKNKLTPDELFSMLNQELVRQNKNYKSRNEKAIEYIKNDWYELNTRDIEHCINLNKDIRIDILNILQGEDKE